MSNDRSRGLLWAILALFLALIAFAAQGQEMKPSANILLPYFEIRLPDPNASSLEDTMMGLVNASSSETEVEFTVYTNWGIPVLRFTDVLRRTEPRVIDLEAWIIAGELPDRTLGEAELAELHAALTGQPSPSDHLYRGTEVGTGIAAGYVIMRTLRPDRDVLWGDSYSLDPMIDYFQGETLATLDDALEAECTRHAIRFSNREELFEGTELIVWTGRTFQPSPTTEPVGTKVRLVSSIYDEAGNHVHDCARDLIAVQVLPACHIENLPPIGWLDMKLDQKSFVQEHLHSATSASAQLHAWCLPVDLSFEGPDISIKKYVNHLDADKRPGAEVAIGSVLQFDYHVKNTGAEALENVLVTDSDDFVVSCPKTTLEPGEHMVCTAESTALPCSHKNIGTVTAQTASGHPVKDRDPAWYTAAYDASLTLEKRVNGDDADTAPGVELAEGATATFTFEVTNTGAVALTNVEVRDGGLAVTCPATTLEPGATMTCTATTIATVGQHANEAEVTAETPCEDEIAATDRAYYFVAEENRPGIDVEKYVNDLDADTPTGPIVDIESIVQFRYVVTNTGNVPLVDVKMEDVDFLTCTSATLAAGASFECGTSIYAKPGQHMNTATVQGHWNEQTVEDTDLGHYFGSETPIPAIDIEKLVNGLDADTEADAVHVVTGSLVTFTYDVTNTGNVILTAVDVTDNTLIDVSCPKNALMPGEKMTCTASINAAEGLHTNIGTVVGTAGSDDSAVQVTDSDPGNYTGHPPTAPDIDIEKFVNQADADTEAAAVHVEVGSTLQFTYVVTNTGDVALTGIVVTDNMGLTVTCPKTALEPAESMTCTASALALLGLHTNVGSVTGTPSSGVPTPVTDTDPANYFGDSQPNPAIDVEKLVNGADADTAAEALNVLVGSALLFTYVVTNIGDATLSSVAVTDDTGLTVTCPKATLVPTELMTCTASATAAAGLHTNIATASGTPEGGTPVTDTDPANYFGSRPSVDIEKLVNQADADTEAAAVHVEVGSTLQFTYVVTNTGDVALTGIVVTDNTGLTVSCPKTTLEPAESMTCTASATALLGLHTNVGSVTGTPSSGVPTPVTDTDPANYIGDAKPNPAIDVEKLVNGADADTEAEALNVLVGSTLLFTYVVTNVGDATLTSVAVTDNTGLTVTCPKTTLVPSESMTCTASATALAGLHTNVGTASGTPEGGTAVTDTDPANYIGFTASIDLEKLVEGSDADTAAEALHVQIGQQVDFAFVVTNTGSVALTNVTVTDSALAVTCPKTTLAPAESMTCTAQTSALAGLHTNLGTVTGTPPSGPQVSDTDPANYYGEEVGNQGCTPGYWKNHTDSWPPTGYSPSQAVDSVFASVNPNFPTLGDATLLQALSFAGGPGTSGAAEILLRAAVAALLNAAHPDVNYPRITADVINQVNAALASNDRDTMLALAAALDADNNRGCPLN